MMRLFFLCTCIVIFSQSAVFAQHQILLDDKDAKKTGEWTEIKDAVAWKGSYHAMKGIKTTTATAKLLWNPEIPVHGIYDLYYWNPQPGKGISRHSAIQVFSNSGKQDYTIDQERSGGKWVYLGTNEWAKGNNGVIEWQNIGDTNDEHLVITADGIKLLQTGEVLTAEASNGSQTCEWKVTSLPSTTYDIYFYPDEDVNDIKLNLGSSKSKQLFKKGLIPAKRWTFIGKCNITKGFQLTGSSKLKGGLLKLIKPKSGTYTITQQKAQKMLGLGIEIQSDGFGPKYVNGDAIRGVPHELVPAERDRLATEMLKGFRYLRLALGLWFRGQTPDNKNIVERYPGQVAGLRDMVKKSGIEGLAAEYWSPPVYWKASGKLPGGGSLKNYDKSFLDSMGNAMVQDLDYLSNNDMKPIFWSLQNEPSHTEGYSSLKYSDEQYYKTFKIVAPKIKQAYPNIQIYNDSFAGQFGTGSALIKQDTSVLKYVDAWAWHRIGKNGNELIDNKDRFNEGREGKPALNNEFEYFVQQVNRYPEDWRMVNTAHSILNWYTFHNSPTWFWLHALKPINDVSLPGFALGVYRAQDDNDFSRYPDLKKGHFQYLWSNWHAMAGFIKHLPWNSIRQIVDEDQVRLDQRIMAWTSSEGKPGFVLTNRSHEPFIFKINTDGTQRYTGHCYDKHGIDQLMPELNGKKMEVTLPAMSITFYVAK